MVRHDPRKRRDKIRALLLHPENPRLMLVPLANDKGFAVIDIQDAELAGRHNWQAKPGHGRTYAHTSICIQGRWTTIPLHKLIAYAAGFPADSQVDHRNHDGLDCRRNNLRPATHLENSRNKPRYKTNKTGFKGVYGTPYGKFVAGICVDKNKSDLYLGTFDTAEEAARAYDAAAAEHFGEFAVFNFPQSPGVS